MKNNKTLIFLVLAGLGVWYYMRNKNKAKTQNNPVAPDTSNVLVAKQAADLNISFSINGYRKRLGNVPNTI